MIKYYDGNKLLSQKKPFNFCVGTRSAGKTFYFKRRLIKQFLKTGEKFIYVRRYKTDLELVLNTFFDDVSQKFPDNSFEVRGNEFYIDDKLAGYAIPVSSFTKYKSVNMNDVRYIFFDEFLPEDDRYIGGKARPYLEPELCFGFYQSVARGYGRPIREEVQFIFVANAVTRLNPYFIYFGIDKFIKPETKFIRRDTFAVEITNNTSVNEQILDSDFGKAIQGTQYGNYALSNTFYTDSNSFIDKPFDDMVYMYTIIFDGNMYGMYYSKNSVKYYISDKADKDFPVIFAITNQDHTTNTIGFYSMRQRVPLLKEAYSLGLIYFRNHRCKFMLETLIGVR